MFQDFTLQVARSPVFCQQVRYTAKINLKKPKAPHFKKALIAKFVKPLYVNPKIGVPLSELCANKTRPAPKEKDLNPYEAIIAREAAEHFRKAQMVVFLHRNSITQEKVYDFQVRIKQYNMHYRTYSYKVCKEALRQVDLERAEPLITAPYGLVFSEEINFTGLSKVLKKTPQFFALAGVLNNQLVNIDELQKYGSMTLVEAQCGLVSILQNAGGMNLTRQLTQHQTTFIDRLTAIQNRSTESTDNSPDKE